MLFKDRYREAREAPHPLRRPFLDSELYEVEFKGSRKELFINPRGISVTVNDYVIVQADRGEDLGVVRRKGELVRRKRGKQQRREIIRKASPEEIERLMENRKLEEDAFRVCRAKIEEHGLKMKLIDVEYQFDRNKISFYFTAEKRVDFRELVKDLASIYRTRIELRQIGVRDEAKRVGGCGVCGRELCCAMFIREFEPISSQMARDQSLPLNPAKISGICGRLMCCLRFEEDFYKEVAKKFPEVGEKVFVYGRDYEVSKVDIFHGCVHVRGENGVESVVPVEKVSKLRKGLRRLFGYKRNGGKSKNNRNRTEK